MDYSVCALLYLLDCKVGRIPTAATDWRHTVERKGGRNLKKKTKMKTRSGSEFYSTALCCAHSVKSLLVVLLVVRGESRVVAPFVTWCGT